ncbi:hypothetical protein KOR42_42280 [Thalassoglobus neptunius]|uniref:Uncharacterized protein n=1 Tax=Thalassoglobus neptunius TaxID=1938619 RepID=A0A5C5WAK0_9PLAN|nr:hypothetical protein KOR42_42280 [Thalassoglobus neptunius]
MLAQLAARKNGESSIVACQVPHATLDSRTHSPLKTVLQYRHRDHCRLVAIDLNCQLRDLDDSPVFALFTFLQVIGRLNWYVLRPNCLLIPTRSA